MQKSLSQLRVELSKRLGFSSQGGAEIIQAPLLESFLQRAQEGLIEEYGSQIGSTVPATPFTDPNDTPSVPERPLFLSALISAKIHYSQSADADVSALSRWEANVRGVHA